MGFGRLAGVAAVLHVLGAVVAHGDAGGGHGGVLQHGDAEGFPVELGGRRAQGLDDRAQVLVLQAVDLDLDAVRLQRADEVSDGDLVLAGLLERVAHVVEEGFHRLVDVLLLLGGHVQAVELVNEVAQARGQDGQVQLGGLGGSLGIGHDLSLL